MEGNGSGLETELRLGLPGSNAGGEVDKNEKKRVFSTFDNSECSKEVARRKNQVVGWPPVCAYRQKNVFGGMKIIYVKVSMDGVPFLRKMDLSMHNGYTDLVTALEQLFGCFGIVEVLKDTATCEYMPIYEDKDGDWMLLGDVPWEMFTESCKRLRIMKKSDAKCIGLEAKELLSGLLSQME